MTSVSCDLCPRMCSLSEGEAGFCQARANKDGKIISLNYGESLSLALDPIEKKPFSYYKQGSTILSYGTFGCNMYCPFCQNYEIARARLGDFRTKHISSEDLIKTAEGYKIFGCIGLAFTYNEPLVGYEYIYDTSKLAKDRDLDVVVVSNGQITDKYLETLLPLVDAWNIDLKAFSDEGYRKLGGDFKTTLNTIEKASETSHLEITTLLVPGLNDDIDLFEEEVKFIAGLDKNIPLHITRYFPMYKYYEDMTDEKLMEEYYYLAKKYLTRVELGNI